MMRHRLRRIPWLLIVAAAVTTAAGCRRPEPSGRPGGRKPASETRPGPGVQDRLSAEFQKARVTWDDEQGRRIWEAQFKEATAVGTGGSAVVELHGVKASLYRDGKVTSSLTAPRVVADSRTREVRATGNVRITSGDGTSLRSDRLVWKSREHTLVGAGAVRMTRGTISVTARSFEADTGLKKARFSDAEMSVE